jgi:hypothetical protein
MTPCRDLRMLLAHYTLKLTDKVLILITNSIRDSIIIAPKFLYSGARGVILYSAREPIFIADFRRLINLREVLSNGRS